MKRRDLIRKLEEAGFKLKRHGKEHDIFESPAKGILRKWGIK